MGREKNVVQEGGEGGLSFHPSGSHLNGFMGLVGSGVRIASWSKVTVIIACGTHIGGM